MPPRKGRKTSKSSAKRKSTGKRKRGRLKVPTPSTVVARFAIRSKKGHKYTVLRTNQLDIYDKEIP